MLYSQDLFSPKDAQRRLVEVQGRRKAKLAFMYGTTTQHPIKKKEDSDDEETKIVLKRQKRIKSAYAGLNVPLERSVSYDIWLIIVDLAYI